VKVVPKDRLSISFFIFLVLSFIISAGMIASTYAEDIHRAVTSSIVPSEVDPSSSHPWPMFRHNLNRTGYTESPAPDNNQTMWTYQTGGAIYSSPAVVNDKVYVGSDDGYVYALNATTTTPNGVLIWRYKTGGAVRSSPTVVDGQVFIGSDDGCIYSLNATNGELIWKYNTGSPVRSSPAVSNEKIIFGSNDGYVYALDRFYLVNGTPYLIWKYFTGDAVHSSPAINDGRVFIGGCGVVYCLNENTTDSNGELIWKYEFTEESHQKIIDASPSIHNGRVFISSHAYPSRLYSLNASTGSVLWIWDPVLEYVPYYMDLFISSATVAYGRVFVNTKRVNYWVCSLNETTGEQIWALRTVEGTSSPTVADDKMFIGRSDGFYSLNYGTGALMWKYNVGTSKSSPAVSDGRVFVGSDDGRIIAFGNASGLTISASPSEITLGGSTLISGKLTDVFSDDGLSDKAIHLEYSTDRGATWNLINWTMTSLDGSYSYIWTPPTAGRYITIRAVFNGDTSYNGATSPGYFVHVNRVSSTLTVTANPSTITYGESASIEGSLTDPNGTGIPGQTIYLEYSADGLTYNLLASVTTLSDGSYSYPWSPSAGSYTIRVNFTGNDNYTGSSCTTSLIVNRASTTITISIDPSTTLCGDTTIINGTLQDEYNTPLSGQTIKLEFSADGGASWNTIVTINTLTDGSYSYLWTPQEVGSYLIRAKYAGAFNYKPSKETTSLTVVKGSSSAITILSATTVTYGQGVTISGVVSPPISDGTITLQWSIDNTDWNVIASGTPSDGIFTETWTPPYIGIFYMRALWSGNLNYNGSTSLSITLTVTKVSSSIVVLISSSTISYGQTVTITGTISPTTDGTVTLEYSVDGSTWLVIASELSSSGSYTSPWKPPHVGNYYIRAKWDGNVNYNGATSTIKTLTVDKASTTISIVIPNQIAYGANVTIQGTTSPSLADIMVTVQYSFDDGSTWNDLATLTTNATGGFSYEWAKPSAGVYQIRASWNGNVRYQDTTSKVAQLSVSKVASSITLILSSISTVTDSSITVSGKISPAMAGVTVTIYYRLEGMTTFNILIITKTDSDGNYSYTWTPQSAGTYQITAAWIGTNNYDGAQSGIRLLNVLNPEQPPYSELLNTIQTLQQKLIQMQDDLVQTKADLNQAENTIQVLQGELSRRITIQCGFLAIVIVLVLLIIFFTLKEKREAS
jgi:outer membrane protein assembly factor BamB